MTGRRVDHARPWRAAFQRSRHVAPASDARLEGKDLVVRRHAGEGLQSVVPREDPEGRHRRRSPVDEQVTHDPSVAPVAQHHPQRSPRPVPDADPPHDRRAVGPGGFGLDPDDDRGVEARGPRARGAPRPRPSASDERRHRGRRPDRAPARRSGRRAGAMKRRSARPPGLAAPVRRRAAAPPDAPAARSARRSETPTAAAADAAGCAPRHRATAARPRTSTSASPPASRDRACGPHDATGVRRPRARRRRDRPSGAAAPGAARARSTRRARTPDIAARRCASCRSDSAGIVAGDGATRSTATQASMRSASCRAATRRCP